MIQNYSTFRELDYQALATLKKSDADIDSETRRYYINDALMKVFKLIDGLADPFYDKSTALNFSEADIGSYSGDDVDDIYVSGDDIRITSDSFSLYAGDLIACVQVKATAELSAEPEVLNSCIARVITSGCGLGADATAEIITGDWTDYEGTDETVFILHILKALTIEGLTASIAHLYLSEIKAIHDDVTRGNMMVFDRYEDLSKFREMSRIPQKKNRIGYIHIGNNVMFSVGEDADPIGNVTMYYRGKPAIYNDTTEDSMIDIPPEYNQMLFDEVIAKFAQHSGDAPPPDVASRMAGYNKLYEASEQTKIKTMEQKLKK